MSFGPGMARIDALVTAPRIRGWASTALVIQLAVLAFLVIGTHGLIVTPDRPCTTDFVSFYAAGMLADGPDPARIYDPYLHDLAEQQATAVGIAYVPFFYPPVYALLCGLLAHLPYLVAFMLFEVATTTVCLLVIRAIVGPGLAGWWLPVVSFSPLLWNFGIGQNAALTASLFGGGTLLHRRHPMLAGLVFACLAFKPHTGLLIPVAIAGSRSRATFLGAALGVGCLVLGASVFFGLGIWPSFVRTLVGAQAGFAAGSIVPLAASASLFGAARMAGASRAASYAIEAVVAAIVAVIVFRCWRRSHDQGELRHASLAAGAPLIMPVVLFYDTVLLLIAGAWLIRVGRRTGFLPGEKTCLAGVWLGGLVCYPAARALHLPVSVAMELAIMLLIMRRALSTAQNLRSGNKFPSWWLREHRAVSHERRVPALTP